MVQDCRERGGRVLVARTGVKRAAGGGELDDC